MEIQWYPGHMTRAKRQMQEDIRVIDLVIELVDARLPLSSRNPDIDELGKNKARLILLVKADLADDAKNKRWTAYFKEKGYSVAALDARNRSGMKLVQERILTACKEKIERDRARGIKNRPIRAMVVGIPNVGKSTFINSFAGKACTKTGNTPGVTKGKQWIRVNRQVELLDTPGILWPKFDDQDAAVRLALIGSLNDNNLNLEELALTLLSFLTREYPGALAARYGIEEGADDAAGERPTDRENAQTGERPAGGENAPAGERPADGSLHAGEADTAGDAPTELLAAIARARNCLRAGGEIDYARAISLLLDDFRGGRLGRITLEVPETN